MVSLSLCRADAPNADLEFYSPSAPSQDKASQFYSLVQSHTQHTRLMQALYRQCRVLQQGHGVGNGCQQDPLADSFAVHPGGSPLRPNQRERGFDPGLRGIAEGGRGETEDPAMLRQETEAMTSEANARINQASDAIRMLKERMSTKQLENSQLKEETVKLRREATEVEIENERLGLQLERHERDRGDHLERAAEAGRLEREVEVLRDQKEALLQILNDLYGHIGSSPPQVATEMASPPSAAASTATPVTTDASSGHSGSPGKCLSESQQGWTNMLPRASEIRQRRVR